MSEPIRLDNTKRKMFRDCKKKYFLSAVHGIQSDYGSTAIRYGVCWHGMQEGYHSYIKQNGWPTTAEATMAAITGALELGKKKWDEESVNKKYNDDYKNYNSAVDMFNAYLDYFPEDKSYLKVISTETKFECPIEPDNEAEEYLLSKLPDILFSGRIDLCVEMDSINWIFDFKTTGWYLDKVIQQANRSPQLIGYSYAGNKVLDFTVSGCLSSFAYLASTRSKVTGNWGNVRFDFRRVPQIYTPGDVEAWKLSFIDTCKDIYWCMQTGIWPESFDNCYQYGMCPYLRLCQQHIPIEELNLEGYHIEFWDVLDGDDD